jgi:hypothetical protein
LVSLQWKFSFSSSSPSPSRISPFKLLFMIQEHSYDKGNYWKCWVSNLTLHLLKSGPAF